MSYAVQFTISSLSGVYAQKYSVVLHDAVRFEVLFERFKLDLVRGLCADAPERQYDPFVVFNLLMKALKKLAKHSNEPFCTAIERESDGALASSFDDVDDDGAVELKAFGPSGICSKNGVETPFESLTVHGDTYHAKVSTLVEAFKGDLMNLMNICEETIAKNAKLIARTVDNSTPIPARLVQT